MSTQVCADMPRVPAQGQQCQHAFAWVHSWKRPNCASRCSRLVTGLQNRQLRQEEGPAYLLVSLWGLESPFRAMSAGLNICSRSLFGHAGAAPPWCFLNHSVLSPKLRVGSLGTPLLLGACRTAPSCSLTTCREVHVLVLALPFCGKDSIGAPEYRDI